MLDAKQHQETFPAGHDGGASGSRNRHVDPRLTQSHVGRPPPTECAESVTSRWDDLIADAMST